MKDWYRFFGSFIKDNTHLEKGKVFEEIPMQPPTDQIYYITINYKAQPKVETVNFTLNLKGNKILENE